METIYPKRLDDLPNRFGQVRVRWTGDPYAEPEMQGNTLLIPGKVEDITLRLLRDGTRFYVTYRKYVPPGYANSGYSCGNYRYGGDDGLGNPFAIQHHFDFKTTPDENCFFNLMIPGTIELLEKLRCVVRRAVGSCVVVRMADDWDEFQFFVSRHLDWGLIRRRFGALPDIETGTGSIFGQQPMHEYCLKGEYIIGIDSGHDTEEGLGYWGALLSGTLLHQGREIADCSDGVYFIARNIPY